MWSATYLYEGCTSVAAVSVRCALVGELVCMRNLVYNTPGVVVHIAALAQRSLDPETN